MTDKKETPERKKSGRKPGQKDYSKMSKGSALALLDFFNGNLEKTARATGVNYKTLASWQQELEVSPDPAVLQIRDQETTTAQGLLTSLLEALCVLVIMKAQNATFRELYYITGIVGDKLVAFQNAKHLPVPIQPPAAGADETPTAPEPEVDQQFLREKEHWEDIVKTIIAEAEGQGKEVSREDAINSLIKSRPEAAIYFEEFTMDRIM